MKNKLEKIIKLRKLWFFHLFLFNVVLLYSYNCIKNLDF